MTRYRLALAQRIVLHTVCSLLLPLDVDAMRVVGRGR